MRVHVVGNCQATVVTSCLQMMNPGLVFVPLPRGRDVTASTLSGDLVLWQLLDIYPVPETTRRVVTFPTLYFNAFHPDLVRVAGPQGDVPAPLGFWHSSLALYGWQRELGVAATVRLFCEPVFERLGFFGYWEPAKAALLEAAQTAQLPLERELESWSRGPAFMHSVNHPKLHVFAGLARAVARSAGIEIVHARPEDYLSDPLLLGPIWPVYTEIAGRLGVRGDYLFKPEQLPEHRAAPALLDLETFVAQSFERYARFDRASLACARLEDPAYRDLELLTRPAPRLSNGEVPLRGKPPAAGAARTDGAVPSSGAAFSRAESGARPFDGDAASPYAGLPDFHFWRRAVERVHPRAVDPFAGTPLPIDRRTKIATAGSCFAQHVSAALARSGYTHFVAEPAPRGLAPDAARRAQYGLYSARYGNVYTARQLVQLFERAHGVFEPRDIAWLRSDGRYADPFRPEVEPDGFAAVDELVADRARHFAAVRAMFEGLDVFVFTLGLTEAWEAAADEAVFPLAPGVSAGRMDGAAYAFRNFTLDDVVSDLDLFVGGLRSVNPAASIVLTVSPVPLVATYEPRHVLVSTAASKAVLRAAADEIERAHEHVTYFPSYEIVTGAFSRGAYFESDLRSVTPEAVEHVMRVFFAHCRDAGERPAAANGALLDEIRRGMEVICDEEQIV